MVTKMQLLVRHNYKIKPEIKEEWDKCKYEFDRKLLRSKYNLHPNGYMDEIFSGKYFKCLKSFYHNTHFRAELEGIEGDWNWENLLTDIYDENLDRW